MNFEMKIERNDDGLLESTWRFWSNTDKQVFGSRNISTSIPVGDPVADIFVSMMLEHASRSIETILADISND